jgi:hypothetical protein
VIRKSAAIYQVYPLVLAGDLLNMGHEVGRPLLPTAGPLKQQLGPEVQAPPVDFAGQRIQRW